MWGSKLKIYQPVWAAILILAFSSRLFAQAAAQKVIIDTDIGDDIDDAFAVTLALSSPELQVIGITSAWGDTELRSRMLDRLLCEAGRSDIPVRTGVKTPSKTPFSQEVWAGSGVANPHGDAVDFLLGEIRKNPGEITLIAIAPLTNIGAAIDRDPATFKKLKRVVMMGGSIHRGYGDLGFAPAHGPDAEYNIAMDPPAAQKLFRSGVPIYMMPLDSTQLKPDETKREMLTTVSTPLTDALQVLTAEWQSVTHQTTPTMFDVMAVAYAIRPELCPATAMHIEVDGAGFTRDKSGSPNTNVCLDSDSDKFFQFLMPRLLTQNLRGRSSCVER
jgi:inosine-uridine nucleoside N-ribohydrolase